MNERYDKPKPPALSEVEGRTAAPPKPTLPLRQGIGGQVASRGRRLLRHVLLVFTLVVMSKPTA